MMVNLSMMPLRTTSKMNWPTCNGKKRLPTKFRKNVLPNQTTPKTANHRNAKRLHWNSVIVCGVNIPGPVQKISKIHHQNATNCDRNWTLALSMILAITIDITVIVTTSNKIWYLEKIVTVLVIDSILDVRPFLSVYLKRIR